MKREILKKYNFEQIKEILKYKWIESEKANRDIGENEAAIEWIEKYSAAFREHWCKTHNIED